MVKRMKRNYSVGIYEKAFPNSMNIEEMLVLAKAVGYDFFEISIDRTAQRIDRVFTPQYQVALAQSIERADFPISSLGLSALSTYTLGHPDEETTEYGIKILQQTVVFAARMGIRIVQIPACDVPKYEPRTETSRKKFLENLCLANEFASAHGVLLGLENMENDFMNSAEKCLDAICFVNSPYFQLYPDIGNMTNAYHGNAEDILNDLKKCQGHGLALHLKEVQPERYGGLFYGEGYVDFPLYARKAYDLGFRRFVMEYWYTGSEEWKSDLINARNMCDSWICEGKY